MRFVDSILRTLVPKNFIADIQIIISLILLSYDKVILPNGLATLVAISAGLSISYMKFYGPISCTDEGVRLVSLNVIKFIINPNFQ